MNVEFFVPGKAAPQGSKRHVGKGILIESSKEVGPWRERVALAASDAMKDLSLVQRGIGVDMEIGFVLPRPASAPKTKGVPAVKRPDIDKLGRAILDALTGIVFEDDSQVTVLNMSKVIADPGASPGAHIYVSVYA